MSDEKGDDIYQRLTKLEKNVKELGWNDSCRYGDICDLKWSVDWIATGVKVIAFVCVTREVARVIRREVERYLEEED